MGSPTLKTLNTLCQIGTEDEVSDEQLVRLETSGLWGEIIHHPDYDALRGLLAKERGELVIRRAKALRLDTCGPKLDLPFRDATLEADIYGEGDGSFDLATVEPVMLDVTKNLRAALEAIQSLRGKISMGERRRRWFIENANRRSMSEGDRVIADGWRKQGLLFYFPDTVWLDEGGSPCVGCAFPRGGGWDRLCRRLEDGVLGRGSVLCGNYFFEYGGAASTWRSHPPNIFPISFSLSDISP